jgi:hypothetical protein
MRWNLSYCVVRWRCRDRAASTTSPHRMPLSTPAGQVAYPCPMPTKIGHTFYKCMLIPQSSLFFVLVAEMDVPNTFDRRDSRFAIPYLSISVGLLIMLSLGCGWRGVVFCWFSYAGELDGSTNKEDLSLLLPSTAPLTLEESGSTKRTLGRTLDFMALHTGTASKKGKP